MPYSVVKKISTYTVLLEDGTVGKINVDPLALKVGEIIKVHLHDENGNPIEAQGKLVEVLESNDF